MATSTIPRDLMSGSDVLYEAWVHRSPFTFHDQQFSEPSFEVLSFADKLVKSIWSTRSLLAENMYFQNADCSAESRRSSEAALMDNISFLYGSWL